MEDQCCTSCEHISNTSETSYIHLWNISLRLALTSSIIIDINHNRLHPMRNNKTIRKYSPGSCRLSDLDTWKSKWSIIYIEELESSKNFRGNELLKSEHLAHTNSGRHLFNPSHVQHDFPPSLPPRCISKSFSWTCNQKFTDSAIHRKIQGEGGFMS